MNFDLTEEQVMIQGLAREFARQEVAPVAAYYDQTAEFPHPIIKKARELGLINLTIPREYGGAGLSVFESNLIMEEIAWACTGIATALGINNLASDPIVLAGSEAQKKKYLGRLADGGFAAYAVTEPEAGSDVAAIKTRALRDGRGWKISGTKIWISNAWEAEFFVVFAKTDPQAGHRGISAFIVERDWGVKVTRKLPKLGQRASDACEVVFEDVPVPPENLLGPEGEGFKLAMQVFDRSRPMIGAFGVGIIQRCLDECIRYATQRQAFGRPIADFQAVGFKIAEMGMRAHAARLLTYDAAWKVSAGRRNSLEAAYAKAFAADSAMWAATEAVQVFGGYGYSEEFPVAKLMRDAKVLQIYEGTSEIQRLIMLRHLTGARGA